MHRDRATTVFSSQKAPAGVSRQKSTPDCGINSLSKSVGHDNVRSRQHSYSESDKGQIKRSTLVPDLDGSRATVHMHQPEHIKKIAVTHPDKPNIFYGLNQVCAWFTSMWIWDCMPSTV